MVLGAGGEAGLAREDHEASVRIVDAETVDRVRSMLPNDAMAAYLLVQMSEPSAALDLEVGESKTSGSSVAMNGGGKGVLAGVGVDPSGRVAAGLDRSVVRTTAGLVFSASTTVDTGAGLAGSFGVKDLNVQVAEKRGGSQIQIDTVSVTLDPDRDRDLILKLEGLPAALLYPHIAALDGAQHTVKDRDQDTGGRDLSLAVAAYDRDWTSTLTNDGDTVDAAFVDTTHGKLLGKSVYADGMQNAASMGKDGALDLRSTTTGAGLGYDADAKIDLFNPLGTLFDLAVDETSEQTIGRTLSPTDLAKLGQLARTPDVWLGVGSKGHGEGFEWEALRGRLASAGPENVGQVLAEYTAAGGDLEAIERLCAGEGLGTTSQWPTDIVEGATRMAALQAKVEAGPDKGDLSAIDGLRNEVANCTTFTVERAKNDTLSALVELRAAAVAKLTVRHPDEAGDLVFDHDHVAIHAGIQRCGSFKAQEAGLYADGLGSDPNRKLADLGVFYEGWKEAVMALREAYAKLDIPEASWAVSPRKRGGEKSLYEPDSVRALRFFEMTGVETTRGPVFKFLQGFGC